VKVIQVINEKVKIARVVGQVPKPKNQYASNVSVFNSEIKEEDPRPPRNPRFKRCDLCGF
jgi:hypothetical protein